MQPIAFGVAESDSVAHCLRSGASKADKHESTTYVAQTAMQVRRLTPVECERLQGFPDNYTNIPWRKAAESPDGPRYKALGNSMAVPVMRWIGKRIKEVSEL
jgi:DNA (cytosine-5)-methyltransferase 1